MTFHGHRKVSLFSFCNNPLRRTASLGAGRSAHTDIDGPRVLPGFTEFYRVLLGCVEFYRVLLGCTGFYWVLPGFTGFYRVLPGFTGFYRVLLGFTGFR